MGQATRTNGCRGICACGFARKEEEAQACAEKNRELLNESSSMAPKCSLLLFVDDPKRSQQQLVVFAMRRFLRVGHMENVLRQVRRSRIQRVLKCTERRYTREFCACSLAPYEECRVGPSWQHAFEN